MYYKSGGGDPHSQIPEMAEGMDLFDKIIEKTKMKEAKAKLHFFQILSAIKYLHFKKICQRNLKPANMLLCSKGKPVPIVKITNMRLSKLME